MRRILLTALAAVPCLLGAVPAATTPASHDLVEVGAFRIDRHEVTVGQFRAFVTATGRRTKAEADGGGFQYRAGWERMAGWSWARPYGEPARDDEPAVHVTWHEARDYCRFAGLRLPTDAEWVAAAYTERRPAPPAPFVAGRTYPYPTGETPDGANHLEHEGQWVRGARRGSLDRGVGHVPVRLTAPGVNGLHDMGANVWEWVDHEVGGAKRTRGGSWWYGPPQMRAEALYEKAPDFPAVYIGFRCAGGG
jgi:formylglycine-generating enzyme required for sulfatase activity